MRPRVFPAEDSTSTAASTARPSSASMRPRVFPAEDVRLGRVGDREHRASMRPRVFPAED